MIEIISTIAIYTLGFITFFRLIDGTLFDKFLSIVNLGWLPDFIQNNYEFIVPNLIVLYLAKYIRNIKVLLLLDLVFFVICKYLLK